MSVLFLISLCFSFGYGTVDLFKECLHKFILRYFPQDLAFAEEEPFAFAACNAEVGFARFARAVDDAAHDGDVDRFFDHGEPFFNLCGDGGKVHAAAAAGRTRYEGRTVFLHAEGFQYLIGDLDFFDRVAGERDTEGVADAFGKKCADTDGGLDDTASYRAWLGDTEVERIVYGLAHETVCRKRERYVMRLE